MAAVLLPQEHETTVDGGRLRQPDAAFAERVRATYGQLPLTLAITVVNSSLVAIVLSPYTPRIKLWCWLGSVLLLAAARIAGWYCYRRASPVATQAALWGNLATVGALFAGALWGLCAVLLFPPTEAGQLFIALVIGGMCAGAATVHATHIPTVVAFILPAALPLAARFLIEGSLRHSVAGVMVLIFAVAMCLVSFRFQTWFVQTFSTQFNLALLTRELRSANARLRKEMSSRLAAEQKLQEAQRMEAIGRLTAGVAHDFNNLLMVISGIADRMSHRLGPRSEHAGDIAALLRAAQRGAGLTRQLLAFGRKQALTPRTTDLNDVLTNMQRLLDSAVPRDVIITMDLDPKLEPVLVDLEQIEQAILNLVINARDALPSGGGVRIATAVADVTEDDHGLDVRPGRFDMIMVSDDGTGMPEDVRARAVEPFFTTKDVGRGSGLGLSQVHGLVHQSGGTMTIDSAPGDGTTVRIYLPVVHAALSETGQTLSTP